MGQYKFHCFYVHAYGNERVYKCFDNQADMLELVRKAKNHDEGIRDLRVVCGRLLEFEPVKIVESWQIKEE